MIRTYAASVDEHDLRAVAPPGTSLARNVLHGIIPGTLGVFGLIYVISRSSWAATLFGGCVLAASLVSNIRFFREVARRQKQQSHPEAVEVIDVDAFQALDIEPLGSHGPAFVFFTQEGRALLLIGQWLLEQPAFPSLSFRVRRWADTGKPIRIDVRGPEITPEPSPIRVPRSGRVRDIELLDATPETLQRDLDLAFTNRRR